MAKAIEPDKEMSCLKDGDRVAFWRAVKQLYDDGHECDAKLVCRGGRHVLCHRIVLASVSKFMRRAFKRAESAAEETVSTVYLPDLDFDDVQAFVNFLYGILAMSGLDFNVEPEVVVALGADLTALNLPFIPAVEDIGDDDEEEKEKAEQSPTKKTERVKEKPKSAALTKKLPFRLVLSQDSTSKDGAEDGGEGPRRIAHVSLLVPKKNLPREKRKRGEEGSPAAKKARTDEEKNATLAKNWPKVYEVKGKELKCEHCQEKFQNWGEFKVSLAKLSCTRSCCKH